MKFLYYYLRSMRLYYSLVTASTMLAGVLLAHYIYSIKFCWQDVAVLTIGLLAWGVNQIFNDYGNLKEDRINAPNRPMVSGKLAIKPALALSATLMLIFGVVGTVITPLTLIPIILGGTLNLLYNYAKKIPFLGCIVYGLSIAMCLLFGYIAITKQIPTDESLTDVLQIGTMFTIVHTIMCYFSNFKDVEGDRNANIITPQVWLGFKRSLILGGVFELAMMLYLLIHIIRFSPYLFSVVGLVLCFIYAVLHIGLVGQKRFHQATCANCQVCVSQILLLTYLFMPISPLIIIGIPLSYVVIQTLFMWYSNEKE